MHSSSKRLWLPLVLISIPALACLACGASTSATTPPTATAIPTKAHVTSTPTTNIRATAGAAILGSAIGPFVTRYGQPNVISAGADYLFQHGAIDVQTIPGPRSSAIIDGAPDHQTWSATTARDTCLALSPSDAYYVRKMTITDSSGQPTDIQYVYVSKQLASEFPANAFTDEHGNQTTLGTFGVLITYAQNSTSAFLMCTTQVGLQSV